MPRLNQYYIPKIGDFVCLNHPAIHAWDMTDPRWQAVGRVRKYNPSIDPNYIEVELPSFDAKTNFTMCFRGDVRKATAYEGMMAFWNPEEETKRYFSSPAGASIEDKIDNRRYIAAKQKADVSNLRVEDF